MKTLTKEESSDGTEKGGTEMFFKKYGDIVVGIFFISLSAVMMVMAQMLPKSKVMEVGPEFMPMVIGVITFALAAALTFLSIKNFKMHNAEIKADDIEDCDYKRVLESVILMLVYVFVMKPVGFILSTLVFLFCQMMVLSPDDERGKKQAILLAVIDVVFTLVVFFLFRYGFKIVLPAGIFSINL